MWWDLAYITIYHTYNIVATYREPNALIKDGARAKSETHYGVLPRASIVIYKTYSYTVSLSQKLRRRIGRFT